MRTRFLGVDCFTSAPFQSVETLEFLRLPPPELPGPSYPSILEDRSCFDAVSYLNISFEIDKFPVDQALVKFFSDVIPQNINFDLVDAPDSSTSTGFYKQAHAQIEDDPTSEEETEATFHGRTNNNHAILQFEMPELVLSLENACTSHKEKMQIFFEVTDAEVREDVHNTTFGLEHLVKIQESIFSVDDINVEYIMEENSATFDEGDLNQIETNCSAFPLLEVDEASLGILRYTSMEGFNIFESTELRTLMHKDELMGDSQELLLSMESDTVQNLFNHCLSIECIDTELSCANFSLEMDFISVIEDAETSEKSEFPQGGQDENFILNMNPVVFEQFESFEVKTSQFLEIFSHVATVAELESCEGMFDVTANFHNFDELIVSYQLTLADDSFKSFPVPVFPDNEKKWLLQAAMEEIIAMMKPQPSSTSDGIYLDWHLLDEDIWNCSKFGYFRNMLQEIDTYSFASNMSSIDNKLLFEFVFSDDGSAGPNMKENMEMLNIEMNAASAASSKDDECYSQVAADELSKDSFQKRVNGEVAFNLNSEKASKSVKSISHFNDLDFFLNPLDCTHGKDKKPTVKSSDRNAGFPVTSSRDAVLVGTTTEVQLQPERDPYSIPSLIETSQKLEELPTFVRTNRKYVESMEIAGECKACSMPLPVQCAPATLVSEQICASMPPSPHTIIVVNTQTVEGEMVISRRSTYQKILAMEKEGAQVVERDLNFPVDVIVNAAICLVWYDSKSIRKKATAPDEAASLLSSCVENIAANVLTSLSFTFSSCILVFEGEFSFLSGIVELSDELYVAAASLGIELQLFCSYSSELTDEIILNCIGHAAKSIRGLYPKMLESETLAESFLTKIPSVNPLSAHAILSSVGMLVEFFEWSHRRRLHALQRYPIHNESINLLSAFCRYGEREDSKSSMTDCSSSVSSAPDSSNCCGKSESEKRKRTCRDIPDRTAMPEDEFFQTDGSKQCSDYNLNPPRTFKPYTSCISKDLEISEELDKFSIAFDDRLFGNKCGTGMMANTARLPNACDFEMSNVLEISPEKDLSFSSKHLFVGQRKGLHMPVMNGLDWPSNNNCGSLQKKFIGEVVDIDDCFTAGKVSETAASVSFSPLAAKNGDENTPGPFRTARNSSLGIHGHPTFPSAAEISSGSASWSSERDSGQNLREQIHDHPDMDFNNRNMPLKHQNMFSQEGMMLNSAANFMKPSFQDDESQYRSTPLSNAVLSGQAQEGSPWTIEFLNRIREKSRLRQKSLPRDLSGPCFGYSVNIAKTTKRKSPSILDFYKYQRGIPVLQSVDRKRQKQSPVLQSVERKSQKQLLQSSSSSKIEKGLPSSLQTWTPGDKRANRRLSFANNGSQGQSKLVWIDKAAQTLNKKH